jgi:hypothetical protein
MIETIADVAAEARNVLAEPDLEASTYWPEGFARSADQVEGRRRCGATPARSPSFAPPMLGVDGPRRRLPARAVVGGQRLARPADTET